jgi:hypothetical protein
MNITHYIPVVFETTNELITFSIELDGLSQSQYLQKCQQGLFRYSKNGSVTSSKCSKCGHVTIGSAPIVCHDCGSIRFNHKETNEMWALADVDGVPERFIGAVDLTPDFWAYNAFKTDTDASPEFIDSLLDDGVTFADIEDAYCVQHLTDAEVNAEYADLNDEVFQDAWQDWPADEAHDGFHAYTTSRLGNEGYNF